MKQIFLKVKSFFPKYDLDSQLLYPFSLSLWSLRIRGLFHTGSSSSKYLIYSVCCRLFLTDLSIIGQTICLMQTTSIFEITSIIGALPAFICIYVEDIALFVYFKSLMTLLDEIKSTIHEYGINERFKERMKMAEKITKYICYMLVVTFIMALLSVIAGKPSFFYMWTPFSLENKVVFGLFLIYQYIVMWFNGVGVSALFMLPVVFMCYIIAMLEQLCDRLESLKRQAINGKGTRDTRKELIACIRYQLKIYAITRKVEEIFTTFFIGRFVLSSTMLCTNIILITVFSASIELIASVLFYALIIMTIIFVPCYYGSEVIAISSRISGCLFHSEWMFEEKEYRQLVRVAMEFAQRPMKIRAGGIFDVDLKSYMSVCNSAYSFYAVLKNLYHS